MMWGGGKDTEIRDLGRQVARLELDLRCERRSLSHADERNEMWAEQVKELKAEQSKQIKKLKAELAAIQPLNTYTVQLHNGNSVEVKAHRQEHRERGDALFWRGVECVATFTDVEAVILEEPCSKAS